MTEYQHFFESENLCRCFGKFHLLSAVSVLTGLSGFQRGSYLQAAAVPARAAKLVQWDCTAAWELEARLGELPAFSFQGLQALTCK